MSKKPLIKICGIKNPEIAALTAQAGVQFIGLVFHPTSKRFISSLDQAKKIAQVAKENHAIPVAVFVNHTLDEMQSICEATDITTVQLHGRAARSAHQQLPHHFHRIYVQSVHANGEMDTDHENGIQYLDPARDFLLFDNLIPGSGKPFSWEHFSYQGKFPWFLAGGVTPQNVKQAVLQLHPDAFDVSSGVENSQGEKDIALIKKLVEEL